ncbi:hypothetical protein S7335_3502 [Synechococcus sp. PCC 7335]|nr:hypothetical protein S7335_3502 [Synechococcus sp. PCC 7335]
MELKTVLLQKVTVKRKLYRSPLNYAATPKILRMLLTYGRNGMHFCKTTLLKENKDKDVSVE